MGADQLGVERQWGATGGEAKHCGTTGGIDRRDKLRQLGSEDAASFGAISEDAGGSGLGHAAEVKLRGRIVKIKRVVKAQGICEKAMTRGEGPLGKIRCDFEKRSGKR